MSTYSLVLLFVSLILLIFVSAFFSGSETGMMAVNRYRLRHLARMKHRAAMRVSEMLHHPERLLGIILIGNTFANILASSIATVIAVHLWGDIGIAIATFTLTLVILIFAEVTPKTLAAINPQSFAFWSSLPLKILLKLLYPVVWLINTIVNSMLKLFHVTLRRELVEHLSSEELSTLVKEAGGKIHPSHQDMLLAILELEKITVEDIMVPRNDIIGIDINDDIDVILTQITHSEHTRIPVFQDSIDNVKGLLHVRSILKLLQQKKLTKKSLLLLLREPYFIPENTQLHIQLLNFRSVKQRTALVVDEYGDIQGLVTLEDILEEIVGEFTTDILAEYKKIQMQPDKSIVVDGSVNVRDLNRSLNLNLDISGPKTLSGLIIEYLEMIPQPNFCIRLSGCPMEIMRVKGNRVQKVRLLVNKK